MKTIKNILIAVIVLALSYGIFSLLETEDKGKEFLTSAITLVVDELIARVPDREQQIQLEQKRDEFIKTIDENKMSKQQYETSVARLTNLNISQDSLSAEELGALLETSVHLSKDQTNTMTRQEAEKMRQQVRYIVEFTKELSNIQDEQLRAQLARHFIVTSDSNFHIIVDEDILQKPELKEHPDSRRLIERLPRKDFIKFENFEESQDIVRDAMTNLAPILPLRVREQIIFNPDMGASLLIKVNVDSLLMAEKAYHDAHWDSLVIKLEKLENLGTLGEEKSK